MICAPECCGGEAGLHSLVGLWVDMPLGLISPDHDTGGFADQYLLSQSHTSYHGTKSLKAFGEPSQRLQCLPRSNAVEQVCANQAWTDLDGNGGLLPRAARRLAFPTESQISKAQDDLL